MSTHRPGQFWLEDETHKAYAERGSEKFEIIRATSAFQAVGLTDTSWFTPESRDRGIRLHDAVEAWHYGSVELLPASVKPYWNGFIKFMAETEFIIREAEQPVYDLTPGYEYGGKYDLFGNLPAPSWRAGFDDLIDLKTGSVPETTKWQTAGYGRKLPTPAYMLRRWALLLPGDNSYRLIPLNLTPDGNRVNLMAQRQHERDFLSIVRVANLKLGLPKAA